MITDSNKSFGLALKKLRLESGLSQQALATHAGLDLSYISLLERCERSPTLTNITKLAAALNITATELVWLTENFTETQRSYHPPELSFILNSQAIFFESILNHIGEAVIVVDINFNLIYCNQAARELHGIAQTHCWPREYRLFLPDKHTPCPVDELPLIRTLRGESPEAMHLYVKHSETSGSDIEVSGKPLTDAQGMIVGGFVISTNITEKILLLRILVNLNTDAERN